MSMSMIMIMGIPVLMENEESCNIDYQTADCHAQD
eukprot:XP_001707703.1 Hypothetical protein GL50803_33296 [Giardia lamblia ATCC 50803]